MCRGLHWNTVRKPDLRLEQCVCQVAVATCVEGLCGSTVGGGRLYACRAGHDALTTGPSLTLVIPASCSRSAKPGLSHWWIRNRANQSGYLWTAITA